MFEYLSGSSKLERRDLLREIDEGELDERYLIKHASDYGGRMASRPIKVLKAAAVNLLTLAIRFSRTKRSAKPMKTVSHPATQ